MPSFWRFPTTLFSYFIRRYLQVVLLTITALVIFIVFIGFIELARRASTRVEDISYLVLLLTSLLNIPTLLDDILPFGILFGSIICFYLWGKNHEFLVTRTVGQTIWQALIPAICGAALIGVVHIVVINPIAAVTAKKYDFLMKSIFGKSGNSGLSVLTNGIWIRDTEQDNYLIINGHALDSKSSRITRPIIYQFDQNGLLLWRMQAQSMQLDNQEWQINKAIKIENDGSHSSFDNLTLQSGLSVSALSERKLPPRTINIYRLPSFISVLKQAGLPVNQYLVFFHRHLAIPFYLVGLTMLAASFTLIGYSRRTKSWFIIFGIASGFGVYFLSDIIYLLGESTKLPYLLAGWGPSLVICLFSGFLLARADEKN